MTVVNTVAINCVAVIVNAALGYIGCAASSRDDAPLSFTHEYHRPADLVARSPAWYIPTREMLDPDWGGRLLDETRGLFDLFSQVGGASGDFLNIYLPSGNVAAAGCPSIQLYTYPIGASNMLDYVCTTWISSTPNAGAMRYFDNVQLLDLFGAVSSGTNLFEVLNRFRTLKFLALPFRGVDVAKLDGLYAKSLETLVIYNSTISDECIRTIGDMPNLKRLVFWGCLFRGDSALKIGSKSVNVLEIYNCRSDTWLLSKSRRNAWPCVDKLITWGESMSMHMYCSQISGDQLKIFHSTLIIPKERPVPDKQEYLYKLQRLLSPNTLVHIDIISRPGAGGVNPENK